MSPRHRQPVDASPRAHGRQLAPAPRRRPWAAWLAAVAIAGAVANAHAAAISQTDIVGPPGSGAFGSQIVPLSNGNVVVTDPTFSGVANGIGAVYLFGGSTQDRVGNCGVVALTNGNYVARAAAGTTAQHRTSAP